MAVDTDDEPRRYRERIIRGAERIIRGAERIIALLLDSNYEARSTCLLLVRVLSILSIRLKHVCLHQIGE